MLCLGAKESADVRSEVAAGLYRKLLKEEVTSRRIDSAASPAKVRTAAQARGLNTPNACAASAALGLLQQPIQCCRQLNLLIAHSNSTAQVIEDLVSRSGFSADAAAELHKSLFRQKLNQVRRPCQF